MDYKKRAGLYLLRKKRKSHQYLSAHYGRVDLSHCLFFTPCRLREVSE